jgi:hypothetical protein
MAGRRFPISYSPVYGTILRSVLLPQRWSYVDIDGDKVRVRMGWAFSAKISRSDIASVMPSRPARFTAGVHGWRGRWLVNGATKPIVLITLTPPARGFVLGFPVRLRVLLVSVDDVDGFVDALT